MREGGDEVFQAAANALRIPPIQHLDKHEARGAVYGDKRITAVLAWPAQHLEVNVDIAAGGRLKAAETMSLPGFGSLIEAQAPQATRQRDTHGSARPAGGGS